MGVHVVDEIEISLIAIREMIRSIAKAKGDASTRESGLGNQRDMWSNLCLLLSWLSESLEDLLRRCRLVVGRESTVGGEQSAVPRVPGAASAEVLVICYASTPSTVDGGDFHAGEYGLSICVSKSQSGTWSEEVL